MVQGHMLSLAVYFTCSHYLGHCLQTRLYNERPRLGLSVAARNELDHAKRTIFGELNKRIGVRTDHNISVSDGENCPENLSV